MTLDKLNKLNGAANSAEFTAKAKLSAAKDISNERNGTRTLIEALETLRRYDYAEHRSNALKAAEMLLRDDLLRIAEVRLEAEARELTATARALRTTIAVYLSETKAEVAP